MAQAISALESWGIGDAISVPGTTQQQPQPHQQHNQQQQQSQCSQPNQSPATASATPSLPSSSFQPNQLIFQHSPVVTQFINAWDDLQRATGVATGTVKSHIVGLLQEFNTQSHTTTFEPDNETQRIRDHNQQIILENTQAMVNIQQQFCVASSNSFSALMCCFVCHAPVGFSHDTDCAMVQQQSYPHYQKRQK